MKIKNIVIVSLAALSATSMVYAASEPSTFNKNTVTMAVSNFSNYVATTPSQSVIEFKSVAAAVKSKQMLKTIAGGFDLIYLTYNDWEPYKKNQYVQQQQVAVKAAANDLNNAFNNIDNLPQLDKYVQDYSKQHEAFWQARVNFFNGAIQKDSSTVTGNAADLQSLGNYLTIQGIQGINHLNSQQATQTWINMNGLAYQIPVDAITAYDNLKQKVVAYLYEITPQQEISALQAFRENAEVQQISQQATEIQKAVESVLNCSYPVKIFGQVIFTVKLPATVKNAITHSINKLQLNDANEALQFLMNPDNDKALQSFSTMQQLAANNSFAKLVVTLSQGLANSAKVDTNHAYWAIMYQLSVQLNKALSS